MIGIGVIISTNFMVSQFISRSKIKKVESWNGSHPQYQSVQIVDKSEVAASTTPRDDVAGV